MLYTKSEILQGPKWFLFLMQSDITAMMLGAN